MKSVYDVLHSPPRLHKTLEPQSEALAQAIVASGRLRIDAGDDANFVRLSMENLNQAVSERELNDLRLVPRTHAHLTALLGGRRTPDAAKVAAAQQIEYLRSAIKKRGRISPEVELMMARALVLCNELCVIRLIHREGAEIFISFGHAVGDVMDIATWRDHGQNSGLQAAGGEQNAVYVSCGGNPFLEDDEHRHSGDGFPALARFMIIAAQETGHNADIIRDGNGRMVGRFSLQGWRMVASRAAGEGRSQDQERTQALLARCQNLGMLRIAEWERKLKFYRGVKARHMRRRAAWFLSRAGWLLFRVCLKRHGLLPLTTLQKNPYPAMQLRIFFDDMYDNLAPKADVYKRADPREEDAIACVEALARVPQQGIKWGKEAVGFVTPRLSALYYDVVIPACEKACSRQG